MTKEEFIEVLREHPHLSPTPRWGRDGPGATSFPRRVATSAWPVSRYQRPVVLQLVFIATSTITGMTVQPT